MITAAQLWYICTVYPEQVTDNECRREYEKYVHTHDMENGLKEATWIPIYSIAKL